MKAFQIVGNPAGGRNGTVGEGTDCCWLPPAAWPWAITAADLDDQPTPASERCSIGYGRSAYELCRQAEDISRSRGENKHTNPRRAVFRSAPINKVRV